MKQLAFKLSIFLCILLLFTACESETVKEEAAEEPITQELEDTIEPEPEKEPEVVQSFPYTYPLTGEGTDDAVDYRVLGVMIENSKSARPQSGLYQADLVYEVLAEGTITRLLAFYHSEQPEIIGPVRSARDYYIHLNNGYGAIYISAGGSPDAFSLINSKQVDHVSGLAFDGAYFYRSSERKAPHNMYTSYDNLIDAAKKVGHALTQETGPLLFIEEESSEDLTAVQANEVQIDYGTTVNNVSFQYNTERKQYLRFNGGQQILDLEDKEPVAADNLFIVEAVHRVVDNVGRRDIDLNSGGKAMLIQRGKAHEVDWQNVDGRLLPFKNGQPLGFLKGKTWINIIPANPGLEKGILIN